MIVFRDKIKNIFELDGKGVGVVLDRRCMGHTIEFQERQRFF
ncbi:MAG: hypothetical protein ACK4UJ_10000 [Leptonema sp. (in: bacteria)]